MESRGPRKGLSTIPKKRIGLLHTRLGASELDFNISEHRFSYLFYSHIKLCVEVLRNV